MNGRNFMSALPKSSAAATPAAKSRLSKPVLLASVATVGWIGAGAAFMTGAFGSVSGFMSAVTASGPGGLMGLLAGLALPVGVVWQWASAERRAARQEALIAARFAAMEAVQVLPSDGTAQVRAINDAFRSEAAALNAVAAEVMNTFAKLETSISGQAQHLAQMSDELSGKANDMTRAMDDQQARLISGEARILQLKDQMDIASDQARTTAMMIAEGLEQPVNAASARMEQAAVNVRGHVDDLWTQLSNLEASYTSARNMAEEARGALSQEAHDVEHISAHAMQQLQAMSRELQPQIELIDQLGRRASEKLGEMQAHIDGQAVNLERVGTTLRLQGETLTEAVSGQAGQLEALQDKVEGFGATISTQFQKQVDTLIETSEIAGEQVLEQAAKGTELLKEKLAEHATQLELITGKVNESVEEVCDKLDMRMALLKSTADDLDGTLAQSVGKAKSTLEHELGIVITAVSAQMDGIEARSKAVSSGTDEYALELRNAFDSQIKDIVSGASVRISHLTSEAKAIEELVGEGHVAARTKLEDDLNALVANVSAQIESVADRVQAIDDSFDGKLTGKTDDALSALSGKIDATSDAITSKLEKLGGEAGDLHSQLDTTLTVLEERTSELNKALRDEQGTLADAFESATTAMIQRFVERMRDARTHSEQEMVEIGRLIDNTGAAMETKFADRMKAGIAIAEVEVDESATRFAARYETALTDAESRTENLAATLNAASEEALGRLTGLVSDYRSDIEDMGANAVANLVNVGRELPEIAADLGRVAEETVAKIDAVTPASEARKAELASIATDLMAYADRIRDDLLRLPGEMRDIAREVEETANFAEDAVLGTAGAIELGLSSSQTQFEAHRLAIETKLGEFNRLFESLQKYGSNIEDVVVEQVNSIARSSDQAKIAWVEAREAMESQTAAATDITDSYIDRMAELSNRARSETNELSEMSEAAVQSVERIAQSVSGQLSGYTDTLTGLHSLITEIGGAAEQHNASITATTEEAERRTTELVARLNASTKEMFLKSASDMVTQLNQLAIDVDQVLDGNWSAEDRKAFADGDKGVSVRRLLKRRNQPQTDGRLMTAWGNDASFRSRVESYLSTFEELLRQANESDPSKMLHMTFLTGDLGKLYMYLSDALGMRKAA